MNTRTMFRMRTAILLLACASPVMAANRYWTGAGAGQSWTTAANWMGNVQPTSSDPAYIGSGSLSPASVVITQPGAISQNLYLGYGGPYVGALTIQGGGQLNTTANYLGYDSGSSGAATVTGAGSKWTTSSALWVGLSGSGTLDIEAGGQVSNSSGYIGRLAGSSGSVTVNGAGSTWTTSVWLYVGFDGTGALTVANGGQVTTGTLYASLSDLHGNGTITAKGAVLDGDLIFDAAHPQGAPLTFGTGGALNLVQDASHILGIGYKGTGTLRITNGVALTSSSSYLGYVAGSNGTATVSGAGSKWTTDELAVGFGGGGTLNILAGGQVITSNLGGHVASSLGSRATATVSGVGSKWTTTGQLEAFDDRTGGSAALTVADGGQLTAGYLAVSGNSSAVRFHVSGDNMMVLGTAATAGSVINSCKINFYVGPSLAAGTYHPIAEYAGRTMSWTGTGSYNAIGGTWNNSAHTFIVPSITELTAGAVGAVSSGQRLRFTDGASGQKLGASFGTVTAGTTFSASLMAQSELDLLSATPGFAGSVLWAWDFSSNITGEVLLSGSVGLDAQALQVWQYQGGVWTPYTPSLQSYTSDGLFSFTADHFGGYAVTTVPEPATLGLLAAGCLLLPCRRTSRRASPV